MLVNGYSVSKPSNIAHIHQHGWREIQTLPLHVCWRYKLGRQFFTKQIFIANIGGQALTLPIQSGLVQSASIEITQGDIHESQEPLKKGWNEFTKGNQMMFVIPVSGHVLWPQADNCIAVTLLLIPQGHANQSQLLWRLVITLHQCLPIALRQSIRQQRDGRFGRDHQWGHIVLQPLCVPSQCIFNPATWNEFFILRDIALQ